MFAEKMKKKFAAVTDCKRLGGVASSLRSDAVQIDHETIRRPKMSFQPPTRQFLTFLQDNPLIRGQIRAAPDQTLLYAGFFFKPMWKEIKDFKAANPEFAQKETLPEVLARVAAPGTGHANLLAYMQTVEKQVPWKPDSFTLWRALSGIFASNAVGAVSFQIGSGITKSDKVFAATELAVLMRNPNLDAATKELLHYFERCLETKQTNINFGLVAG